MNTNSNTKNNKISDFSSPGEYSEGQEVDLVIKNETDLGFKVIVNEKHWGVLYRNEVFKFLEKNQNLKGFIKKIREDGKLDLTLYKTGHKAAEDVGPKILSMLEEESGFLPITNETSPESIYENFGVSKKKFKIALSGLYKKRLVTIDEDGIRLIKKK